MDKKEIILLLIKSNQKPIVGTTRLQKLLFLVEKELGIKAENDGFKFEAYKYGPASKGLYDDLDFLNLIGYIQKSDDKEQLVNLNIDELDNYTANMFLSENSSTSDKIIIPKEDSEEGFIIIPKKDCEEGIPFDESDSVVYRITENGIKYLKDNNLSESNESKSFSELTKKYNNYSITSLLQYVYRNYPDYTGESEIKDNIL